MTQYYIGFDNGTMGTKIAVYSIDGSLISEAYREHEIKYPRPGWAEMDPDQFYRVVTDGISECMKKSKINPANVRGISCSGIICGIVPIGENWNPVGPYVPFLDGRAQEEAEYVRNNSEPVWAEEAGNSEVSAYMPPLVLKWFMNKEKNVFKKIRKTVSAAQYVLGRLGELKAEDAFIDWGHLSGWVIGFDAQKKNWSEKQMKELGLPYDILPKVVKPWQVVGTLSKKEAEKIGLVEGIPLVAGSGDIMQSNLGSGVVENGSCSDVAGTASIFTILSEIFSKKISETKMLNTGFGTLDNQYTYWGFIPAGGLSLRWFRDEILREKGNDNSYDIMNKIAADIPMGSDAVLFYPFLQGRSTPIWPNASASWLGLSGGNNIGNLYRSILESIAFEYLSWVNVCRSIGVEIKDTTVVGGGSKSDLWNQLKADVLNSNYVTLQRSEGAGIGNVILAAYGVGDIPDIKTTIKEWVKVKSIYTPIKSNTELYGKVFKAREEILNGPLKEIFNKIADLRNILLKI
ncbi:MAG: xylulokinase [Candidatus Humimicrobiaceae bacterium]